MRPTGAQGVRINVRGVVHASASGGSPVCGASNGSMPWFVSKAVTCKRCLKMEEGS